VIFLLRRRKEFLQKACQAVSEIGHHIDESHLMSFANELTLSLILAFFPLSCSCSRCWFP
jgi:uncharacterized BrkB/YihY/UPF0761 family membrane protein